MNVARPVPLRRLLLPLGLIALLFSLLSGCLYLPLPEHAMHKSEVDFRKLVGESSSGRPIQAGLATQSQVVKLLGQPPAVSENGRMWAYGYQTESGVWLYPLCFNSSPATVHTYILRLKFNAKGVLEDWDTQQVSVDWSFINYPSGHENDWLQSILEEYLRQAAPQPTSPR